MKKSVASIITTTVISLLGFTQMVHADLASDAERIFKDAQRVYSQFFPTAEVTQTLDPWLYRHYPSRDIYLGVNKNDGGVYGLGGVFGDSPLYLDTTDAILALLQNKIEDIGPEDNNYCDDAFEGIDCVQNGYSVNETSNGQCIKIPEDTSPKLETGINVLHQTNTSVLDFNGITSNDPRINSFFDAFLQSQANLCTMHVQQTPPDDISNYTINSDVCIDLTDEQNNLSSLAESGLVEVTPPISIHIAGVRVTTVVDDCFMSDAKGVFNAVTKESWIKQNGEFIKLE